ncbi:MAG: Uma2 family endonuclease [Rhodoferax sp.]|nr:Uma2 family endonuclease [Rhodoferax sp.]
MKSRTLISLLHFPRLKPSHCIAIASPHEYLLSARASIPKKHDIREAGRDVWCFCALAPVGYAGAAFNMSDMRLHIVSANSYFYPDVMVTCSAQDHVSALLKSEPKLIVEVLSANTAAFDRSLKFTHYRSLPSLEEYVLIDLDTRSTDCYRKGFDGLWVLAHCCNALCVKRRTNPQVYRHDYKASDATCRYGLSATEFRAI